jgi:DNA primase
LTWLHKRGLTDQTIKRYRLGYSPGAELDDLYIPRGVVIPCLAAGELWYLKIRTNKNKPGEKYTGVKGNRTAAIYGADDLRGADMALFCEGEFDCMLANQEIGDVITAVTFGSATNMPDLATWGMYLLPITSALLAYDTDRAGQEGGRKVLELLGERAKLALLPEGDWKDITEFHQAGGDLWQWVRNHIEFYTVLPTGGAVESAAALGGVMVEA